MIKKSDLFKNCNSQAEKDAFCVRILQNKKWSKAYKELAFSLIYKRHAKALEFYLLQKIQDSEMAADLTAITMAKAYEKIETFTYGTFSTWLYKIAKHNLIDYIRKENSKERVHSIEELKSSFDDGSEVDFQIEDVNNPTPQEELVNNQQQEFLKRIIESFSHQEMRDIFKLRIYKNMQYDEIAETLNIPVGTVKTSIFRGKAIIEKKAFLFS